MDYVVTEEASGPLLSLLLCFVRHLEPLCPCGLPVCILGAMGTAGLVGAAGCSEYCGVWWGAAECCGYCRVWWVLPATVGCGGCCRVLWGAAECNRQQEINQLQASPHSQVHKIQKLLSLFFIIKGLKPLFQTFPSLYLSVFIWLFYGL